MSWQEEELSKRRAAEEDSKKRERDLALMRQEIERFWAKLIAANDNLPNPLKLPVIGDTISGKYGKIIKRESDIMGGSHYGSIYFNTELNRLEAHLSSSVHSGYTPDYYLYVTFQIIDSDADILIKNLATDKDLLTAGFEQKSLEISGNMPRSLKKQELKQMGFNYGTGCLTVLLISVLVGVCCLALALS